MAKPYAEVIGDPIAHSKSPLIHNFWLQKLGIDAEYRATHVRAEELDDYFTQRRTDVNWRGCNVTIPHKVAAMSFSEVPLGGYLEQVGAINCLAFDDQITGGPLRGFNFDIEGVWVLPKRRIWQTNESNFTTCIIGAGGAARAAFSAKIYGAVRFLVRDPEKAAKGIGDLVRPEGDHLNPYLIRKADRIFSFDQAKQAMAGVEYIINASPLGMTGYPPMPSDIVKAMSSAASDASVLDMVYSPLETEFLRRARDLNLNAFDGLKMLVAQASSSFGWFYGVEAPRQHDDELRALLTA